MELNQNQLEKSGNSLYSMQKDTPVTAAIKTFMHTIEIINLATPYPKQVKSKLDITYQFFFNSRKREPIYARATTFNTCV